MCTVSKVKGDWEELHSGSSTRMPSGGGMHSVGQVKDHWGGGVIRGRHAKAVSYVHCCCSGLVHTLTHRLQ